MLKKAFQQGCREFGRLNVLFPYVEANKRPKMPLEAFFSIMNTMNTHVRYAG